MRRAFASTRFHSLLVYLVILGVVFTATLTAGFVFAHEPQRETVSISVRETPRTPPSTRTIAGVINAIAEDGTLTVVDGEVMNRVEIPDGVPMTELTRLPADGAPFDTGTQVNLGTADTDTGFIVTGIVAVEGATP